jgi:hypothetical protein
MNATEITRMLAMFDAAYGPKMKEAGRDMTLVIEVWTMVLESVPWTPYGESTVSNWLKEEPWPPAPSDIRERAKAKMRHEREHRENQELFARLDQESQIGLRASDAPKPIEDMRAKKIRAELERLAANGRMSWRDIDAELARRTPPEAISG